MINAAVRENTFYCIYKSFLVGVPIGRRYRYNELVGETSKKTRQFERFDVSHCELLGGRIAEAESNLQLSCIGLGGCSFYTSQPDLELVPPKEVVCTFFARSEGEPSLGGEFASQFVVGNLIYLSPANSTAGLSFQYGIKFHQEDRKKMTAIISCLEGLAKRGELARA